MPDPSRALSSMGSWVQSNSRRAVDYIQTLVSAGSTPRSVETLMALTSEERIALVAEISAEGWEPGCWIEVDDDDLITTAAARDLITKQVEQLDPVLIPDLREFEGE